MNALPDSAQLPAPVSLPTIDEAGRSAAAPAEVAGFQSADLQQGKSPGPPSLARMQSPSVLLPFAADDLSSREMVVDQHIRTVSLVIIACGVIYTGMYYLQAVLIPFLIAIALKYLLTPLIDFLSCKGQSGCRYQVPRPIAVLLSFLIGVIVLLMLAGVILSSINSFTAQTELYKSRVESLLQAGMLFSAHFQQSLPGQEPAKPNLDTIQGMIVDFAKSISLTDLILGVLGTAGVVAENLMYIVLFLVFMLLHAPSGDEPVDPFVRTVDKQIFVYIRGKSAISAFVAITNATILAFIGLDLWLAFGVIAFFLNFIPNIGMFISVLLPMPLIGLDPQFSPYQIAGAFLGPLLVGSFAKDVLEPVVLGNSTSLHPIAVLLSIMLFASVWGITGMIMAVPMTAVLRIFLSAVDHPLPRAVAAALSGSHKAAAAPRRVAMM